MSTVNLFATGFVAPVEDAPGSVAASTILQLTHALSMIDDGAVPTNAVIVSVAWIAAQGSFGSNALSAGIQPYMLQSATEWSGVQYAPPPPLGVTYANDAYVTADLSGAQIFNPITTIPWTRADLFSASFGWWAIWNNTQALVPRSAQPNRINQFYLRVTYDLPATPTPVAVSIQVSGYTQQPLTYTFRINGINFEEGAEVVLVPPSGVALLLNGAAIINVIPIALQFVTTRAVIGTAGTYTIYVRNPSGVFSDPLTFVMAGPGVIVTTPPGYMHNYGYAFVRPALPNTTNAPLGLAPYASVGVYALGTLNALPIYADADGVTSLANPFTADDQAFYSFYAAPLALDILLSGGGILTPYTLGDAQPLDPRIPPLENAVAILAASLASGIDGIDVDLATVQAVPGAYPLGGSLTEGSKDASQVDVVNPVTIELDGTLLAGYTATVTVTVRTEDAGTSVQAILRNLTTAANVGSSAASIATGNTVLTFTATLAAGVNRYKLQLLNSNASAFTYVNGMISVAL